MYSTNKQPESSVICSSCDTKSFIINDGTKKWPGFVPSLLIKTHDSESRGQEVQQRDH